ncbi:hypothetical protein TNCV_1953781 [Trichonephila clavipes]|nr:hypothetical protein TNCV_1953781 [Trichonephila clavipes]
MYDLLRPGGHAAVLFCISNPVGTCHLRLNSSPYWANHKGLGSNPGEDVDVCKCMVPLWHGVTLNSLRAAIPLVCLVEGVESWEAPDHHQVSSLKIGVESQIVPSPAWCSKLRPNDRR